MAEKLFTGAEIICKSLEKEKVEVIFGHHGGAILSLYDILPQYPNIHRVVVGREDAAATAADGYARASGKVGVCLVTSGPGATNLSTGITAAHMDSSRLVAITGQVDSKRIGTDAFQEVDIKGMSLPVTKFRYSRLIPEELTKIFKEAFYLARTGRPGSVIIDVPSDALTGRAVFNYPANDPVIPGYWPQQMDKAENVFNMNRSIDEAIVAIRKSKSPVIIAGNGIRISEAYAELKELVDKIQAPVVSTLHGLAAFPQDDPRALGMIGMHGTELANTAVREADLIIAIGMRFDDRATATPTGLPGFAPNAKVVHIDIDAAEIGKNVRVDVPIVGDAKRVLQSLNSRVPDQNHPQWLSQIEKWRIELPKNQVRESDLLLPQYLVERFYEITKGKVNVTTGVGQHQMIAALGYNLNKPNRFFSSGGLGHMGAGLPLAIGVQCALPEESVWDIDGDGSWLMSMQELGTVVTYRLPIKMLILDNASLGMVRQWQDRFQGGRHTDTDLQNPDFVKIAEAFGIPGERVNTKDGVDKAIRMAMEHNGPFLIHAKVVPEPVHPFVVPINVKSARQTVKHSLEAGIGFTKQRVLVALVKDRDDLVEEVGGLCRKRGYTLQSVTKGDCKTPGLSIMTFVVETKKGDPRESEQVRKQLAKVIGVVEVTDITEKDTARAEMLLVGINRRAHFNREDLHALVELYSAKYLKGPKGFISISVTGEGDELNQFLEELKQLGCRIDSLTRTGLVGLRTKDLKG